MKSQISRELPPRFAMGTADQRSRRVRCIIMLRFGRQHCRLALTCGRYLNIASGDSAVSITFPGHCSVFVIQMPFLVFDDTSRKTAFTGTCIRSRACSNWFLMTKSRASSVDCRKSQAHSSAWRSGPTSVSVSTKCQGCVA